MPHAEADTEHPQTNGPSSPSYKTIDHLKTFPIVTDTIESFTNHPLGQRSISLSHTAYMTFIAPLSPYLSKAAPYVTRADEIADTNLVRIESRFPIVKQPTEDIKNSINDAVFAYPRRLVGEVYVRGADFAKEGKEYVFKVYDDEIERVSEGGAKAGVIPIAKAGVTTGLVVSSELMGLIAGYLGAKKEEVEEKVEEVQKGKK